MKERIKKLRKEMHLTQQGFADRIGIKRNTIANYEIGRNEPIDAVISLICRTFHVNETWLRTGEGEMFNPAPEDNRTAYMAQIGLSQQMQTLVNAYLKLSLSDQKAVDSFIDALRQTVAAPAPAAAPPPPEDRPAWMTEEEWADFQRSRTAQEWRNQEAGLSDTGA